MNAPSKNKLLTWLVFLLLVANAATIATFWLNRAKHPPPPKGTPSDFLVKELGFDNKQQELFFKLVKEHQEAAGQIRKKIKESKDAFFDLLKQPGLADSVKKKAAEAVSRNTEQLDLLTLDHFQKVRALCNSRQQEKFDSIIHEVTSMMARPQPIGPGRPQGPAPGGPENNP
jgi:protein CpxP